MRNEIKANLSGKSTEELRAILKIRDRDEWSDDAFDVAREILEERGEASSEIQKRDPSSFSASLSKRYSDAYTEANAVVKIGKIVKGVAVILFIVILIIGFVVASESNRQFYGRGDFNGAVAGIGFALSCLVGIPIYVLGILVAAQGQTSLATLDTAINSSRHLSDDDVALVLSKRFHL